MNEKINKRVQIAQFIENIVKPNENSRRYFPMFVYEILHLTYLLEQVPVQEPSKMIACLTLTYFVVIDILKHF
jgi:hypothetical protein